MLTNDIETFYKNMEIHDKRKIVRLEKERDKYKNIVEELEGMIQGDIDGFSTINLYGGCNDILEVLQNYKDKLQELKGGSDDEKL